MFMFKLTTDTVYGARTTGHDVNKKPNKATKHKQDDYLATSERCVVSEGYCVGGGCWASGGPGSGTVASGVRSWEELVGPGPAAAGAADFETAFCGKLIAK